MAIPQQPERETELVSSTHIATLMGVSPYRIRSWVSRNLLPIAAWYVSPKGYVSARYRTSDCAIAARTQGLPNIKNLISLENSTAEPPAPRPFMPLWFFCKRYGISYHRFRELRKQGMLPNEATGYKSSARVYKVERMDAVFHYVPRVLPPLMECTLERQRASGHPVTTSVTPPVDSTKRYPITTTALHPYPKGHAGWTYACSCDGCDYYVRRMPRHLSAAIRYMRVFVQSHTFLSPGDVKWSALGEVLRDAHNGCVIDEFDA